MAGYLTSVECGAFPHAGNPVVPLGAFSRESRLINAFAVVPYSQTVLLVVPNLDFQVLRVT